MKKNHSIAAKSYSDNWNCLLPYIILRWFQSYNQCHLHIDTLVWQRKKNVCDYAQFRLSLFKVRLNALAHGHHTQKTMRRGYPAHKICILCPKRNLSKTNDRCLLIVRWSIVQMILATAIAKTLRFVCGTWDEFPTQNPNTTAHKTPK